MELLHIFISISYTVVTSILIMLLENALHFTLSPILSALFLVPPIVLHGMRSMISQNLVHERVGKKVGLYGIFLSYLIPGQVLPFSYCQIRHKFQYCNSEALLLILFLRFWEVLKHQIMLLKGNGLVLQMVLRFQYQLFIGRIS